MIGKFILSLDCEGKWGVADALTQEHHRKLTDDSLRDTYSKIARLLAEHDVRATWAFTGFFLLDRERQLQLPRDEIGRRLPYARFALQDLVAGSREGWSAPWALDEIGEEHEIASHGVTHTPWNNFSEDDARFEMSLLPPPSGSTFIFPRNQVAHLTVLREFGIRGYRMATRLRPRTVSLARELNVFANAEVIPAPAGLQPIPAGYFINWRSGLRKLIPPQITRARARHILEDAAREGKVAHFWTHPENIATAPATLANLTAVIGEVSRLRDAGKIEILTQQDFCRNLADEETSQCLGSPLSSRAQPEG